MNEQVEVILSVLTWEGEVFFYYTPELEILGYGLTEKEAQDSHDYQFSEFLSYNFVHDKPTFYKVLENIGWKTGADLIPPDITNYIKENMRLSKVHYLLNDYFEFSQK